MRNAKLEQINENVMKEAVALSSQFKPFIHGYRVLFLIHRNKEGGDTNNTKVRKMISRDADEWIGHLYDLLIEMSNAEIPLRIYASVNERDFNKAMRQFKYEQLDADYFDEQSKHQFYLNIKDRFIGCLMQPKSSKESQFIIDCDSMEEYSNAQIAIGTAGLNDNIVKQYPTRNGWHIVMKPFNPALLGEVSQKINKDSLILIKYSLKEI